MKSKYEIYPIGKIHKESDDVFLEIFKQFKDGMLGLKEYSHIVVLYWFSENDNLEKRKTLRVIPRQNPENPLTGVFACCSPARPNLIATTVCKIKSIKENLIYVESIDAINGSPIIDIKPFFGHEDIIGIEVPNWAN